MVAAVEAGGDLDQIMQRLIEQADENTQIEASSSAPMPDNVGSNIPGLTETEERDVEMEDEISNEIANADALDDYDIEVNIEGEAIKEYLSLLESVGSSSGQMLSSH